MTMRNALLAAVAAVILATAAAGPAEAQNYTVNGQFVAPQVEAQMYAAGLPPGHYWYDPGTGNYGIMGNFTPLGNLNAGVYAAPNLYGGSGQVNPDGSWSHFHEYGPSGGVGGDGQGCYYAGDWSNC